MNTCNAGSATLSVNIDGPSKVKMDCRECPEGYKITYTPMAPGNYLITIKYGGPQHIVGSPFKAKITGPPHAVLSDVIKPNVPLRKSVQVRRGKWGVGGGGEGGGGYVISVCRTRCYARVVLATGLFVSRD